MNRDPFPPITWIYKTDVSVSEALDVITTHADDGVLFIVDNVHLNQAFARDCFDYWKSGTAGSHLLLIGRDTTTIDFRGAALPLDDLIAEAQTLEVTQEDLEGVFLRLARRVPPPPILFRLRPGMLCSAGTGFLAGI